MIFTWDINPIAATIPVLGLQIHWYGCLFAVGFLLGYYFVYRYFKHCHYQTNKLDTLLLYMFLGTIIGARLGHCLFYQPDFYLANPLKILKIWEGGLASHGGAIGLAVTEIAFCYIYKFRFLPLVDLLCIPTIFVGGLIRLGNLFNSEIYGKPTNSDFGIIFARLQENPPVPRHPVQLYESVTYFAITICLLCIFTFYKKRGPGFIVGSCLTLVFIARMMLEQFKPEQADYALSFLTVGQLLSIPFILLGLAFIAVSFCTKNKNLAIMEPM